MEKRKRIPARFVATLDHCHSQPNRGRFDVTLCGKRNRVDVLATFSLDEIDMINLARNLRAAVSVAKEHLVEIERAMEGRE